MKTSTEVWELGERRLDEAKLLLDNGFCEGALYLAGYSTELFLKARICDLLQIPNLFDATFTPSEVRPRDFRKPFYTHELNYLLHYAGLRSKFDKAKAKNPKLADNWSLVCETWSEDCRYLVGGSCQPKDVERFIDAIEDGATGVKQWIKNA